MQEINIDPSVSMSMAASGEAGSQMQAAAGQVAMNADEPLDGSAAPASLESQALAVGALPVNVTYLSREYVWGTGDWGVDELLVQYDESRRASWPLQDVSGDVIALCDLSGANASARIITQLVYDAYGNVIGRDDPANPSTGPPELRVGHKGLFFDRLDAGISDPLTGRETPRLEAGAKLSGHVRNRTLHCGLGRWNQRDPNMTGLVVQGVISFHGTRLNGQIQALDLEAHFVDGANVYQYVGGNPLRNEDATGLFMGGIGGLAFSATTTVDLQADWTQEVALTGQSISQSLTPIFSGYMIEQYLAFDWVSDWDQPDLVFAEADDSQSLGLVDGSDLFFRSRMPPGARFPSRLYQKYGGKYVIHHIATPYGKNGAKFTQLFAQANMKLGDIANALPMLPSHHKGRHCQEYHDKVYKFLNESVGTLTGDQAKYALKNALRHLRDEVRSGRMGL